MPIVQCPIEGCSYTTADLDSAIVAALLTTHALSHSSTPVAAVPPEKVKRPSISAAGSSEDWSYFQSRWNEYTRATKLSGTDKVIQLLECCDEALRKDLTRSHGGSLIGKCESDVLAAIKTLAVREENIMVARVTLNNMRQDRDEAIRSYGARLKGQANVCKFIAPCPSCNSSVNYTEPILRDVLTRGIADPEIQLLLLSEKNQDMSLEDMFLFVEAKEAGKRSATCLLEPNHTSAVSSSYKRSQRRQIPMPLPSEEICNYCGQKGHGQRSATSIRANKCDAFGHTCRNCQKLHHFEKLCRSTSRQPSTTPNKHFTKPRPSQNVDQLCDEFSSLCVINSDQPKGQLSLEHHQYDSLTDTWKKKRSQDQPFISLKVSISPDDYIHLGFDAPKRPQTRLVEAMADTGCQSCLMGQDTLAKLGVSIGELIPVTMKMHAANNQGINILGAIICHMTGQEGKGKQTKTRQIIYVTDSCDKFFLSRQACVDLGLVPSCFPAVGSSNSIANTLLTEETCDCPKRSLPPPPIQQLPFAATEDNREKLQSYLLDYYRNSTFNTCEHQPLPQMSGPPLKLMIDPTAEPTSVHVPIPVPLHWRDQVKADLDRDVRLGVIEPVPIGEPVTWCHRMIVCAKKNGKPRRTVDLQTLNSHAIRETHHTPSPFHQARSIPRGTYKSVVDAWNGYHSVPLRKCDRHFTTFITPWGRYRYCAAPQGYVASGDGYTRRYDEIVANIPNKTKCVDDVLLWNQSLKELFFETANWLDVCGRNGITLNPDKFVFGSKTVEFAGFEISIDDVKPARKFLDAILNFPSPKNITDVRSWFGLLNQVSYSFSMATKMSPFRHLLKPQQPFCWSAELDKLFEESKSVIINELETGVKIFDCTKPTCLATDWSKQGIGFWLLQKHCGCQGNKIFCCHTGWKVALVGSRFTSSAESRYAPIEGEALAVADALEKARFFVLGCSNLTVAVDHKPLLKIFHDRSLAEIPNPRLRNLKEKTLRFQFNIVHIPGAKNRAADTISRQPVAAASEMHLSDDVAHIKQFSPLLAIRETIDDAGSSLSEGGHASAIHDLKCITWEDVKTATASDDGLNSLLQIIETGFPNKRSMLPKAASSFFPHRDSLYTMDGVILYRDRIVIPPSLRQTVLETLHSAHQGVSSMNARAEGSIFWPGISNDILSFRASCHHCNQMMPSQPSAPPTPLQTPSYPFQYICADYFSYKGRSYLVLVDRYSNWPIVETNSNDARGLLTCLRRNFTTYGIPEEIATDGGPQFTAEPTRKFLKQWGVHHRLSSVAFPHSNTRAELAVKTVKRLITDNVSPNGDIDVDKFQRAILEYRNTPDRDSKVSPAMCIFGRPIRDFIPILPGKYEPHRTWRETLEAREDAIRNRHMRDLERLSAHTKQLPPLQVGDLVRIQNQIGLQPLKWDKTGMIVEVRQFDQYVVRVDGSGRVTVRNRKFLRKYRPVVPAPPTRSILDDMPATQRPDHAKLSLNMQSHERLDDTAPSLNRHPAERPTATAPSFDTQLTERPETTALSFEKHSHERPDNTALTTKQPPAIASDPETLSERKLHDDNRAAEEIIRRSNRAKTVPKWHESYVMSCD